MPRLHRPDRLLDTILAEHDIKNDRHLSITLGLTQSAISKIRIGVNPVSAEMMIGLHEQFGMSIARIKQLAG